MRPVTHIVLHCTAGNQRQTPAEIIAYWKAAHPTWAGRPGYHQLITADGVAHRMAADEVVTYGVANHNQHSIHICYTGGIDAKGKAIDNRTPAQVAAMARLIRAYLAKYPGARVVGHRDFSPDLDGDGIIEPHEWVKMCPCFDAAKWWASVNP